MHTGLLHKHFEQLFIVEKILINLGHVTAPAQTSLGS